MRSIILIGYMCVGKTTVGKALAARLGLRFYDLDWYIETRFCKRVPQIFAERGENHFRDLERRMLHEVAEFEDIVLSCGGGTPCFYDNMEYMNAVGHTFYLRASAPTLLRHLAMSRGERPLLKGKTPAELAAYVTAQLDDREPFYTRAHCHIDIDVLDEADKIDRAVDRIVAAVAAGSGQTRDENTTGPDHTEKTKTAQ